MRAFRKSTPEDSVAALKKLEQYFVDFTEIILLSYEIPKHFKDKGPKDIVDYAMKLRHKFEDVHKQSFSFESKLLNRIEDQKNIPKDTLKYLTVEELENYLKCGSLPDIEKRKKFMLIRYADKNWTFYDDPKLWKILVEDVTDNFVKGNIAFKGKHRGKVRLITKVHQANDLQEGEILVTSMTDPRYVPAMKKAGAIVTDEGGITCHAAIVARELKKPCIIGTKHATIVFKTGDIVEVDADKGVVRKL